MSTTFENVTSTRRYFCSFNMSIKYDQIIVLHNFSYIINLHPDNL